jgi:hypothetical protein
VNLGGSKPARVASAARALARCWGEADGHTIMFKIDYFAQDLSMHSPDPADPSVTRRVITIMLAEEY